MRHTCKSLSLAAGCGQAECGQAWCGVRGAGKRACGPHFQFKRGSPLTRGLVLSAPAAVRAGSPFDPGPWRNKSGQLRTHLHKATRWRHPDLRWYANACHYWKEEKWIFSFLSNMLPKKCTKSVKFWIVLNTSIAITRSWLLITNWNETTTQFS